MTAKLRVAMGTMYPYDEGRIRGGVEAVAVSLTRALADRDDVDLHIVSCNRSVKRSFAEQRGRVTFHWLATGSRLYTLRSATINAYRVHRIYERIRPDIIHAQGFCEYAVAAADHAPMVLTVHGLELFAPALLRIAHFRGPVGLYRRLTAAWVARQSLRNAAAVVSIAGSHVPLALGATLPAGTPTYEIANPLADRFWSVSPDGRCSDHLVLCVGDIIERKNALGLTQAFARVAQRVPSARLHLAGGAAEPGYYAQVRVEVARLGLEDRISFLGLLDEARLLEAYARCAVVVQASIQETAPMALAQAMAAGRPVVATRAGGTAWVVDDGVTGYLVDVGDMVGLAERITWLLEHPLERQRLGQAAREVARQRFAAEAVAAATVQVYRDVLKAPSTPRQGVFVPRRGAAG